MSVELRRTPWEKKGKRNENIQRGNTFLKWENEDVLWSLSFAICGNNCGFSSLTGLRFSSFMYIQLVEQLGCVSTVLCRLKFLTDQGRTQCLVVGFFKICQVDFLSGSFVQVFVLSSVLFSLRIRIAIKSPWEPRIEKVEKFRQNNHHLSCQFKKNVSLLEKYK